ncbi:MAG: alpha/beta fold hydrolase [Actinobacteria bacterium]|nr:alpha/beta fold hydrolase [Actinomycetota bacterium]
MSRPLEGIVQVEGGSLAYQVAGTGPAVVLIHPGLWDMRAWDDQFELFAERFTVLRYDVRGYGRSSRPSGTPYSHVRDQVAVMDAAGVDVAALVGCSMGGGIELDFALTHPDRVRALVVVASSVGGFQENEDEERWWDERTAGMREAFEAGDLARVQEIRLSIWAPLGTGDSAGRRIRDIAFDNIHELTMDESAAEELDPPAIERLEEIACPTLVMPADHDPPDLQRASAELAARIPGAVTVAISDTDHVVGMRRPREFNDAVLAFLERTS